MKFVIAGVNITAVEAALAGWGPLIDLKDTSVVPLALVLYVQQQIAKGGIGPSGYKRNEGLSKRLSRTDHSLLTPTFRARKLRSLTLMNEQII